MQNCLSIPLYRLCFRCQLSSSDFLTKTSFPANSLLTSLCTLFSPNNKHCNIVRRFVNQLFRNKSSLRLTPSSSLGLIRRLNVERSPSLWQGGSVAFTACTAASPHGVYRFDVRLVLC